uniref:ATP-grasp domain-containing protein n=1 Tax=Prevotella sp. GTC17253 TaxID=3236793 RepID=A0AB33IQZ3_9BACT
MFCSCGRRVQLLKFLKESLGNSCKIIATDLQDIAPALYVADKCYLVPRIDAPNYVDEILKIAKENDVRAITTLIDPEIELLAKNRDRFEKEGILVLAPSKETAHYCFDKYEMFRYLQEKGIRTVLTYDTLGHFKKGYDRHEIDFPVFIKPRTGSGSVGIHKCETMDELESYFADAEFDYIIQEYMKSGDCDADVYIDCYSHKPVAAFSKRKLETKIGGASKTISFKDPELFAFIEDICQVMQFNGPVDMDFWYQDGQYYLSEVNPRFGGAYLHAYGAGVDFFKLIQNNMEGKSNESIIGQYDEDILMMMYDAVVIRKKSELLEGNFSIL